MVLRAILHVVQIYGKYIYLKFVLGVLKYFTSHSVINLIYKMFNNHITNSLMLVKCVFTGLPFTPDCIHP